MKCSNIINLGIRIPLAKICKRRIPFQIFFRLTEQCNLRCTYCMDDYPRLGAKRSTTKQVLETIDGLARLGTRRITFFGGEPLLRNDIEEIVTHSRSRKMDCSLTTNGVLIDKNVNVLKNLDQLSVSLDGDKAVHDAYRGKGAWDAAIHAIEVARSYGVSVQLMCTITKLTDKKLESLLGLAQRYDCWVDINIVRPLFNEDGSIALRPEDSGKLNVDELLEYHINNPNFRLTHNSYVMKYVRDWSPYTTFNLLRAQVS
ncbi:radical SAM protein, partial [Candidatus Pacearchaeota archaeon]|nr:radical SAM protein [Candidatus Pacearchaeota archaeon]